MSASERGRRRGRVRRNSSNNTDSSWTRLINAKLSFIFSSKESILDENDFVFSSFLVFAFASSMIFTPVFVTKNDIGSIMCNQFDYWDAANIFKMRPIGVRWRDEADLARFTHHTTQYMETRDVIVMPVMTERAGLHLVRISGQLSPTTSTASSVQAHDPSLEDIELIDVLWRGDIAAEKGAREVGLADQYERDLQLLTEKSIHAPLSNEESSRFEDLSKAYFEDFYATPYLLCSGVKSQSRFEQCREFSANKEPPTDNCLTASTPTDPNYGKLFESFKEGVQLDHHFCGDIRSQSDLDSLPLVNNVSLSEGIVFTAQNVSEMSLIHEHQQTALAAISSPPAPASLYNETSVPALWMQQADIAPSDIYPNNGFISFQNDTEVQVVSTGIQNDHQYCSSTHYYNETPSCQLQSVFDLYHSTRNTSLTDESLGSSTSTSASPRYYRETKNSSPHSSRYFGKLAPKEVERTIYPKKFYGYNGYNGVLSNTHTHAIPRRRGRQSKDEQLAAANQLPLSAREISEMTLGELNRTLKNLNLTELQKQLIRKIRRRGKNKLAARTCRERRGERQRNLLGVGSQWKDLPSNSEIRS